MLNFFSGACFGVVIGFLLCSWMTGGKREDECRQCPQVSTRDMDIRALNKSRDILRNRCDQLELKVHALKSSNGRLAQEVQRTVFLKQREA